MSLTHASPSGAAQSALGGFDISLTGSSVVTLDDIPVSSIRELIAKARYIDSHRTAVADTCSGRVLATLFYEPSTRTRLSFETAMLRLGGQVVGFAGAGSSSASKGETVADTLFVMSNYADVAAIRHPKDGAALVAAEAASIPVINAGDGGHMHPTQTLADLATLHARLGRLEHFTLGLCGDLKFGRTVHSLIQTLCRFGHVRFVLISPDELRLPRYVLDCIEANPTCSYTQVTDLADAIGELDALYMTRVQQERFDNEADYLRLRDTYILDAAKLCAAKTDMAILHPLPRVNEIAADVDRDPRAAYFEQTKYGMLMRMALLSSVLGDDLPGYVSSNTGDGMENGAGAEGEAMRPREVVEIQQTNLVCGNPRCMSGCEPYAAPRFYRADDGAARCRYCDEKVQVPTC